MTILVKAVSLLLSISNTSASPSKFKFPWDPVPKSTQYCPDLARDVKYDQSDLIITATILEIAGRAEYQIQKVKN